MERHDTVLYVITSESPEIIDLLVMYGEKHGYCSARVDPWR
jgi:hypothetical protein